MPDQSFRLVLDLPWNTVLVHRKVFPNYATAQEWAEQNLPAPFIPVPGIDIPGKPILVPLE